MKAIQEKTLREKVEYLRVVEEIKKQNQQLQESLKIKDQ